MITQLLGKIAGLFEKEFLFGSFLPALLFLPAVLGTAIGVLGLDGAWGWYASLTVTQQSLLGVAAGLLVVVFAYVLSALRPAFIRAWSGRSGGLLGVFLWGVCRLREDSFRKAFRALERQRDDPSPWQKILDEFGRAVDGRWQESTKGTLKARANAPAAPQKVVVDLRNQAVQLADMPFVDSVRARLQPIVDEYSRYNGDSLALVYRDVKLTLCMLEETQAQRSRDAEAKLDREFGPIETVRATVLGNIIESYNAYPWKRYRIEAEIYWSRLLQVIPPTFMSTMEEPRIGMDFSLTMATLATAYAVFALFVGPWLYPEWMIWLLITGLSIGFAAFFYRLAVGSAIQLGELVRAAFDLFRLDLLEALYRPHPATLSMERGQWEEVSRLAMYGNVKDFPLRPRKT
jgi:hypothetical protein